MASTVNPPLPKPSQGEIWVIKLPTKPPDKGLRYVRGLRLTVRRVLEAMAIYPDREERKREYPELQDEDIRQALAFAAGMLDDRVLPLPSHG
jgi:uncharacterized protein (DUF433 family)